MNGGTHSSISVYFRIVDGLLTTIYTATNMGQNFAWRETPGIKDINFH